MLKDSFFLSHFKKLTDNIAYRFVKDSFWSFWGSLISQLLGFIIGIITSRTLGKVHYGEYGMILNTINLLTVIVGLGFNVTAIRFTSQYRKKTNEVGKIINSLLCISFSVSIIGAGVYFLFAPWLATSIFKASDLIIYVQWSVLLLVIRVLQSVISGFMIGMEWFRWMALSNMIILLFGMPASIFLINEYELIGALNSQLFVSTFTIFLYGYKILMFFKKDHIPYGLLKWPEVYKLVAFSFPAYVSLLLVYPFTWLTNTFLIQQKDGFAQMGVVNAVMQIKNIILFFPGVLSQAVIPILTDLYVNHLRGKILKTIVLSSCFILLILLPIMAAIVMFPDAILGAFGHEFIGYTKELTFFIASYVVMGVITPISQIILVAGKMWIGILINLIWGMSLVFISWYLIGRGMGAEGLALANLISNFILALLHVPVLFWLLPISKQDKV